MKRLGSAYYIIEKPRKKIDWKYIKSIFSTLSWSVAFIARYVILNIILGPDEVRLQQPFHVLFLTDDRTEKGSVIVNLLPGKFNKTQKAYPYPSEIKERLLSLDNPTHKSYIDSMIIEIGLLLEGKSNQDKCTNKKFEIEDLYIKGIERLEPSLADYFKKQIRQKYNPDFFKYPRQMNLDFFTLETSDHAVLESVQVSSLEEKTKPMSARKFIISCMARNQNYMHWLKDFYTSAKNIECTVISFNYRGIDYSKGLALTADQMVKDALAQARRLIELGASPENIAYEGMSIGAAIATLAAAKMHDKGFKVKLYNERSYRSIIRLMIGYLLPASHSSLWSPINWFKYIAIGLLYITIAPILWCTGWHIDAASAWNSIPPEYKIYSVARNHQNPDHYDDDPIIHDSFSSIASLMAEKVEKIQQKQKQGAELSVQERQILADDLNSHEFTLDRNNKINTNPSPHSAPRRFLVDTQTGNISMQTYMIENLRSKLGIQSLSHDLLENPNQEKTSSMIQVV